MKSFSMFLQEAKGQKPAEYHKPGTAWAGEVKTEHKAGDTVYVSDGASSRGGVVKRIGASMIHISHDGGESEGYDPKVVHKTREEAMAATEVKPKSKKKQ